MCASFDSHIRKEEQKHRSMSGRGKGGKGLGAEMHRKKQKSNSEAEDYKWKNGEEAVVVAHIKYEGYADVQVEMYFIPTSHLHPLLKSACSANKRVSVSDVEEFENNDLFDHLKVKDIRKFMEGDDEADEDKDDDEDDEDEDEGDDDREDVMRAIVEWTATLSPWSKNPSESVNITCRLSVYCT